jgi:flavin-dependent dehydrogenase
MTTTADALVIGGGPAGAAAAARLVSGGLRVVLCERATTPRPRVCGEFVSATAALELEDLGPSPEQLGARPITQTRIFIREMGASVRLPFRAWGLSRGRLDRHLLDEAARAGGVVQTSAVRTLDRTGGVWSATLGDGQRVESGVVILATGKHDLRGHPRVSNCSMGMIGFKMHYRLRSEEAEALGDAVELYPYDSGYAGLQLIESGSANLCLVINPKSVRGKGDVWSAVLAHLEEVVPALTVRLQGARPLWDRPVSIARIPYGYVCTEDRCVDGLYRVGDQAAVIPSLAGEGIAIALRTARLAAEAVVAGRPADQYIAALRQDVLRAVQRARLIEATMRALGARGLAFAAATPGLLSAVASETRLSANGPKEIETPPVLASVADCPPASRPASAEAEGADPQ